MIIESIDGLYYFLPQFIRDDFVGQVDPESGVFVIYLAGKRIPKDFHVETTELLSAEVIFNDDRLKTCRQFQVLKFKKPIPKPDRWATSYSNLNSTGAFGNDIQVPVIAWHFDVSKHHILTFLQGVNVPALEMFLGKNPRDKIRQQVPYLRGAKITDLNYGFYLQKLDDVIRLERRDAFGVA